MRLEKDPGNITPASLLLTEYGSKNAREEFEKKYHEIRKDRESNERAKREREEFRSKHPLRFP